MSNTKYISRQIQLSIIKEKINDGKVSGKRGRGRLRLTFENTVLKLLEEGYVKSMYEEVGQWTRLKRYVETVAFGPTFSLTTPLGIKRKATIV